MNVLEKETDRRIRELLAMGWSIHRIERALGVSRYAIGRRRYCGPVPHRERAPHIRDEFACDWCGHEIGFREFHRRTRRTKHKFCGPDCYRAFYAWRRADQKCKRCGAPRTNSYELFTRGLCAKCYQKLRQFGFDGPLVEANELLKQLREEVNRVSGNQKHSRPAKDAHRDNSGCEVRST